MSTRLSNIPLLDVNRQNQALFEPLEEAFRKVLHSGRFIMGSDVNLFEEECARYLGSGHAVSVSSGTDALLVSLMCLDLKPADEVICPTYSFFATAGCISRAGATPVMVDIDPATLNIDPQCIEKAITSRTKAIVPVHLFGRCADMQAIMQIAEKHGLAVIEDAAQAFGSRCDFGMAGTIGSMGCFSFFPAKNLGGFGDGGLVVTNDDQLAERVRVLRSHGSQPKYFHKQIGGNFRMDTVQCAMMRVKLPHVDGYIAARRANASYYNRVFQELETPLRRPPHESGDGFNQYVIRVSDLAQREAIQQFLSTNGISTAVYYPVPLHLQDCYQHRGGQVGDCPVAEEAARTSLAIPVFSELTHEERSYIAETVNSFLNPDQTDR